MLPFISIIIPCRNEARSIARCLTSVLASDYPPDRMEVLVADGLSTDRTRETLAAFVASDARVRILDNPERITPAALNLCIRAARGAYILRVDAHSEIHPCYVRALVDFLEQHPDAWGAGGAMRTVAETPGLFSSAITTVLAHRFGVGNSGFRTSQSLEPEAVDTVFNCCWRRDVFARVGLFHAALVRSQDIEMSRRITRAGGTLWRIPQAQTTYFARTDFFPYLRHNFSNGIWSLKPAQYLGHLPVGWRHLVPMAFVAAVLASGLIAAGMPALRWFPLTPLAPYAFLTLLISAQTAWRQRDPKQLVLLPLAFAGLHVAYGAGSIYGALQVLASRLWTQRHPAAPAFESTL